MRWKQKKWNRWRPGYGGRCSGKEESTMKAGTRGDGGEEDVMAGRKVVGREKTGWAEVEGTS